MSQGVFFRKENTAKTPGFGKSHFSRGNVAHVTFLLARLPQHYVISALRKNQESNIANFAIRQRFWAIN
jgi:hypothetical protein